MMHRCMRWATRLECPYLITHIIPKMARRNHSPQVGAHKCRAFERQYSRFLDVPNQPADRKFDFLTFLMVRDNGAYTLDGKKSFCVLAGFSWQYQGAAKNPGENRGMSTAVGAVAIDQNAINTLTTALASGGAHINDAETMFKADPFTGWSAMRGCKLVPEPTALSLLLVGLGMLMSRRWSDGPGAITSKRSCPITSG
jgi:hypothetical protein